MDQMNTLAADLNNFAPESTVNGAWNARTFDRVLNQTKFYAQPDYMVEPEYSIAGTGEADLLVRKQTFAGGNVDRKWRVVYEGKTRGGASWDDIRTQVIKYPKAKLTEGQVCWCIGGTGKLAKFGSLRRAAVAWNVDPWSIVVVWSGSGKMELMLRRMILPTTKSRSRLSYLAPLLQQ
ncbi:hypothetical protein AAF712_012741 [Marasmius tenuissimus]|uniref:Uncharacterized protein n=1 Tax=Marasmius tenuissimus TaxID=585030 RepID=A0ABR2ZGI8_9AGAR